MRKKSSGEVLFYKSAGVSLGWNAFLALAAVTAGTLFFSFLLAPVLSRVKNEGGTAATQQLMETVSCILYLFGVSLCGWIRGKRHSKRPRAGADVFLRGVFLALAILIFPGLVGVPAKDPASSPTMFFLYMSFLPLTKGLGMAQLSLMLVAAVSGGLQYGFFRLGCFFRKRREAREE